MVKAWLAFSSNAWGDWERVSQPRPSIFCLEQSGVGIFAESNNTSNFAQTIPVNIKVWSKR
jgi:hypothetical protein